MVDILGPKEETLVPTRRLSQGIAMPDGWNAKVNSKATVERYNPHYNSKEIHIELGRD